MNPPVEHPRPRTFSMEPSIDRMIGQLQGSMEALKDSVEELKDTIVRHMDNEEEDREKTNARLFVIEAEQKKQRFGVKVLLAVAAGGGSLGAMAKYILEKLG